MHAYINASVVAFSLGGLFAIYRNKELMAASKKQVAKHLVSLHAKAGILGAALALLAFSTSIYKTYLAKPDGRANYIWCDARCPADLFPRKASSSNGACTSERVQNYWL